MTPKGCCALCGQYRRMVRLKRPAAPGLPPRRLCVKCGDGLANFDDNPQLLRKAAAFVETYMGAA